MSRIIVGVGGGIAAYKACTVVRQLAEAGHSVRVVPTESALQFVGAATFEALSGEPARTGVFDDVPEVPHVRLGQDADPTSVATSGISRTTYGAFRGTLGVSRMGAKVSRANARTSSVLPRSMVVAGAARYPNTR